MKDKGIDRAIRNTLAERGVREQEICPDDSRIAAYLDSRLLPEENAEFEAHAARCEACREILALSMRLGEENGTAKTALPAGRTSVLFHFAIPASALALLVIVLGAGIFYFRATRSASKAPADTQTADMRLPTRPPEPPQLSRVPEREPREPLEPAVNPRKSRNEKGAVEPRARDFSPETPLPAPEVYKDEAPGESAAAARLGRDKVDAPLAPPAERTELKAESAIVAGTPKAGPDAISQPPAMADRFRSLQAKTTGALDGAASQTQFQKSAVSGEAQTAEAGRHASGKPPKGTGPQDTREIRGRTFVRAQDIWVDNECKKHPEASVLKVLPDSEEYLEILKDYPELRELRPVMIFWEGKKLVLR